MNVDHTWLLQRHKDNNKQTNKPNRRVLVLEEVCRTATRSFSEFFQTCKTRRPSPDLHPNLHTLPQAIHDYTGEGDIVTVRGLIWWRGDSSGAMWYEDRGLG